MNERNQEMDLLLFCHKFSGLIKTLIIREINILQQTLIKHSKNLKAKLHKLYINNRDIIYQFRNVS